MKQQFSVSEINTCWVNGELFTPAEKAVSAIDHGIIVGDAVFETIKVVNGSPFAITRHLKRLVESSQGMGLNAPDSNRVLKAIEEVLNADRGAERLRITWSSGPGPLSSSRGYDKGTLLVASSEGTNWPSSEKIHLSKWTRNENSALKGIKSTSYAENVIALKAANDLGCSEAIFLNTKGDICEGTGTNIFFVIDEILITPSLDSGCLAGITRDLVIELTPVVERDISLQEISKASEAFLTSSTRDISAISAIDELVLPEATGNLTRSLKKKFANLIESNIDP
jgi:branched-chain amino acid aminotransferase